MKRILNLKAPGDDVVGENTIAQDAKPTHTYIYSVEDV